jgi:hypothetical protein
MPGERTYLSDSGVTVTNRRMSIGGKTYATKHTSSVEAVARERTGGFYLVLCICGLLGVGAGVLAAALGDWETFGGAVVVGGLVVLLSYIGLKSRRTTYLVRVSSSSGEVEALKTTDRERLLEVVQAIRQAITEPDPAGPRRPPAV